MTQFQLTFDARDPQRLARFWGNVLGYVSQPPPEGFDSWDEFAAANNMPADAADMYAAVVDPDGVGPRVLFLRVPEDKSAKNRMHLDVVVPRDDRTDRGPLETRAGELEFAGGTRLREMDEHGHLWFVMADPEGNEFCLV